MLLTITIASKLLQPNRYRLPIETKHFKWCDRLGHDVLSHHSIPKFNTDKRISEFIYFNFSVRGKQYCNF